jgi:hypothetical protein
MPPIIAPPHEQQLRAIAGSSDQLKQLVGKLGAEETPWGLIAGGGGILAGSGGYTVTVVSTGLYRVTWEIALAVAAYAVLATPRYAAARGVLAQTTAISATQFEVATSKGETATASDFSFVVIGG